MSANLKEVTAWEAALEIALERDKNVQRLIRAVKDRDYGTADLLAEELDDDEESDRSDPGVHGIASRKR